MQPRGWLRPLAPLSLGTRPKFSPLRRLQNPVAYTVSAVMKEDARANELDVLAHGQTSLVRLLRETRDYYRESLGGSNVWESRLRSAYDDVSADRPIRIGFLGDAAVRSCDVISALVQDPYASNPQVTALTEKEDNSIVRTVPAKLRTQPDVSGVDFVEISGGLSSRNNEEDIVSSLLRVDLPVVILDQYRLMDAYRGLLGSGLGPFHIVVNGRIPEVSDQRRVVQALQSYFDVSPVSMTFVDATKALKSLKAFALGLESDSPPDSETRMRSVQQFQEGYTSSGIEDLRRRLALAITPQYRFATVRRTLAAALAHADHTLAEESKVAREVSKIVADLETEAENSAKKAKHLSVVSRGIDGGFVEGGPQYAVQSSRQRVLSRFQNQLSWLTLLFKFKVEAASAEMTDELSGFGAALERELVFESGRLAQLQDELSQRTDTITRRLAGTSAHPFSSPLLVNHLASLSLSVPAYESDTMIAPIEARRQQLQETALPRLQKSAYRILYTTFPLTAFGVFNSWLLCAPPLSLISPEVAAGSAVLVILASVAAGQRMWKRAQGQFMSDFDRISALLREDLKTKLDTSIETRLLAKTKAAVEGLQQLASRRNSAVMDALRRLDDLKTRCIV